MTPPPTIPADDYQAWITAGCPGDPDAWLARRRALATAAARADAIDPAAPLLDTADPGPERRLQTAVEAILWAAVRDGRIRAYYHRPDRAPKAGELAGLPDLLIALGDECRCPCCGSAVVGVELKARDGRLGAYQVPWMEAFGTRRGIVARSVDAVRGFLAGVGVRV